MTIQARSAGEISLFQVIPILTRSAVLENYRGEVEYMDRHVGRLLNALKNSPEAERTAVVLFADHGEGLGEREGFIGHVRFLNRQFIRVPLFVRIPGETPLRIDEPVSLQALASLLSDVLGIEGSGFPRFAAAWSELRRGRCGRSADTFFHLRAGVGKRPLLGDSLALPDDRQPEPEKWARDQRVL